MPDKAGGANDTRHAGGPDTIRFRAGRAVVATAEWIGRSRPVTGIEPDTREDIMTSQTNVLCGLPRGLIDDTGYAATARSTA